MSEVTSLADSASLAMRLVLAAIFGAAGVLKLRDRRATYQALVDFGLGQRLAPTSGVVLPALELVVAATLLVSASARPGAMVALILLGAFTLAIVLALHRGHAPDCNCFGHLSAAPVGPRTLVRNACFASLAVLVIWLGPGPDVTAALPALPTADGFAVALALAAFAALGLETWLLLHVLRQQGRMLVRLESLEASGDGRAASNVAPPPGAAPALGAPAPPFNLPDLSGREHTLSDLLTPGQDLVLLFMDTHCPTCRKLMPEIAAWDSDHARDLSVACISIGEMAPTRAFFSAFHVPVVLVDEAGTVAALYGVAGTPTALTLSDAGRVLSPLAEGADDVRSLIARTRREGELLPATARARTSAAVHARHSSTVVRYGWAGRVRQEAPGAANTGPETSSWSDSLQSSSNSRLRRPKASATRNQSTELWETSLLATFSNARELAEPNRMAALEL
jgi:peroxiredoxin/uncharacterized membrane protein YphA (DoxX/SURF4 family)